MIERREPLENPAGDSPGDTNALLDALRDGEVVRSTSSSAMVDVYFQMTEPGRIERVSFAGTPPAVHQVRAISAVEFAGSLAKRMGVGLGEVALTTTEELEQRERARDVALAFTYLGRLERELAREDGGEDGE